MSCYICLDSDTFVVQAIVAHSINAECFQALTSYRYICMRATPKWWQSAPKLGNVYRGAGVLRFNGPPRPGMAPVGHANQKP